VDFPNREALWELPARSTGESHETLFGIRDPSTLIRFGGVGKIMRSMVRAPIHDAVVDILSRSRPGERGSLRDWLTFVLLEKPPFEMDKALPHRFVFFEPGGGLAGLWALWVSGRSLDRATESLVFGRTAHLDPRVRSMAALLLGGGRRPKSRERLIELLEDDDHPGVRRRAAMALGRLKSDKESSAALVRAALGDLDFTVRTQAAAALGRLRPEGGAEILKKVLHDVEPFVCLQAARALVLEYRDPAGVDALIDLMGWDNHVMKGSHVKPLLAGLKGGGCRDRKAWRKWWAGVREGFEMGPRVEAMKLVENGKGLISSGRAGEGENLLRRALGLVAGHPGASGELSDLLNGRAWGAAKSGRTGMDVLGWAEESVRLKKTAMNLDTLAVILFLRGEKEKAKAFIREAIELAPKKDRGSYEARLAQMTAGRLKLE
jgi:hypothetical protein